MNVAGLRESVAFALRERWTRAGLYAAAISGCIALGVAGLYWLPQARATHKLEEAIARERAQAVSALERRQLAQAYAAAAGRLAGIEKKMGVRHAQTSLIGYLARLARRHDLRILGETYEQGEPVQAYRRLDLDLDVQGAYPDVRGFLSDLEGLPTWTVVREASLIGLREPSGSVKAHLRLATYYRGHDMTRTGGS